MFICVYVSAPSRTLWGSWAWKSFKQVLIREGRGCRDKGFCSVSQSCLTLCGPMDCSTSGFLSFTISQSLLKLMSTEWVMSSNHLILVTPLSSCLQSFPSSGSFPVSCLFASGGRSIGASASVLLMRQGRNSQETVVQPWGRVPIPHQGAYVTTSFEFFYRANSPNKWKILTFFIPERRS